MKEPIIRTYRDRESMAKAAAARLAELADAKIASGQRFSLALSGGSTPKLLYDELVGEFKERLDWSRVDFFWSDERYVPIDHEDSNMKLALDNLLRPLDVEDSQIYLVDTSLEPANAAAAYQSRIESYFAGRPSFDLILLGLGPDGHTASLFPGTKAVEESVRLVAENWVEKLKSWRITFTFPLINSANNVIFMIAGKDKTEIVSDILLKESTFPAARVRPAGKLYWYLDREAAGNLTNI